MTENDPNSEHALLTETVFYGGDGTVHDNDAVDVEVYNGQVVAVWFRCSTLPFVVHKIDSRRADEMRKDYYARPMDGVVFKK